MFPRQPLHDGAHLEPCLQALLKDARLAEGPWADLGTGSGALAIGLASMPHAPPEVQGILLLCKAASGEFKKVSSISRECTELQVWAVDMSKQACKWASLNVNRLCLGGTVQVGTAASTNAH